MAKKKVPDHGIASEVLDALLAGKDPNEVLSSDGLIGDLKKALAERVLNAEMDVHLDAQEREEGNHRNGYSQKTILDDDGALTVSIPRDRHARFEPQLIQKYVRRFPGFDRKIISMYGRGMTTREIRAHVEEIYGLNVSPSLISAVTEAVHEEITAWRNRPLDPVYAIVYLDALRAKIRDEGVVQNKAVYLAIGVGCDGRKSVLGMWIQQNEGAKFWLKVLTELKNRGLQDILIAVVDGLKGFPAAIEAIYPETIVQTCIVHLLRHSMRYASWQERKKMAPALKRIYQAPSAEAALEELEAFAQSELGQRHKAVVAAWHRHWDHVIPFFDFDPAVRRIIYTTNAIESLHSSIRRAIRTRGHFPNDRSAMKLIYLALRRVESKWKQPPKFWHQARAVFGVRFEGRFTVL